MNANKHPADSPGRRFRLLPQWLLDYDRRDLPQDLIAGVVVAILLVPQGMAYALLAGLPPAVGLYASILPVFVYALIGTSRSLAVGPTAIVSLLTASAVTTMTSAGSDEAVAIALSLALLVGVIQVGMGLLRLGFLANFLSHAVLSGFTSAAALIIALSQVRHLFGLRQAIEGSFFERATSLIRFSAASHGATIAIGCGAVLLLLGLRHALEPWLASRFPRARWRLPLAKSGPLAVIVLSVLAVKALGPQSGVSVVGTVPVGLPHLTMPSFDPDLLSKLLPTALAISLIGFLESLAVAEALASKKRQKIVPDRELVALGAANFAAASTGGLPVTGGFARSVVNDSAGARSGLASMITALLIALSLAFFTPWFEDLPRATLAAVIVVAVLRLFDPAMFFRLWRYCRGDAAAWLTTFASALALGVEKGIVIGALVSVVLHLWRTSRPHVAIVGRVPGTEHFRNVLRHEVDTEPTVLAVRVDESLFFANTRQLEHRLLAEVADRPTVEHLVVIASAVNFIDGSALETLESLIGELAAGGVTLHLAEVKGPVEDRLERVGFLDRLAPGRVFLSTHEAIRDLSAGSEKVG